MNVYEKVRSDYYKSKLPYDRNNSKAWREDSDRLHEEFKKDLFEEFGVQDSPKKDRCYQIAYDLGHAYGYSDVLSYFSDIVELIK